MKIILKRIGKSEVEFLFFILMLEYVNTLLRNFGIVPVEGSVFFRKLLFAFLFLLAIYKCFTMGLRLSRQSVIGLIFYIIVFFTMIIHSRNIDVTAFSNVFMPAIILILSNYYYLGPNNRRKILLILYFSIVIFLYIENVILGSYRYKPAGLNSIYFFLLLTPLIFYDMSKKIQIIVMIFVTILTVISFKSTAIIILAALYLLLYFTNQKNLTIRVILFPIIAIGFLYIALHLSYTYFGIDIMKMYVRESIADGGNGRVAIWTEVIDLIRNNGFYSFLMGNGYNSVSKTLLMSAHNDFLEILYDYGIFSLIAYIAFLISMLLPGLKFKNNRFRLFIMLYTELLIMLMLSNSIFEASYYLLIVLCMNIDVTEEGQDYHDKNTYYSCS